MWSTKMNFLIGSENFTLEASSCSLQMAANLHSFCARNGVLSRVLGHIEPLCSSISSREKFG